MYQPYSIIQCNRLRHLKGFELDVGRCRWRGSSTEEALHYYSDMRDVLFLLVLNYSCFPCAWLWGMDRKVEAPRTRNPAGISANLTISHPYSPSLFPLPPSPPCIPYHSPPPPSIPPLLPPQRENPIYQPRSLPLPPSLTPFPPSLGATLILKKKKRKASASKN